MAKYCGKCGTPLNDGAVFCPNCGTKAVPTEPQPTTSPAQSNAWDPIMNVPVPPAQPVPPQPTAPVYQPVKPKSKFPTWLAVLIPVVVVLILAVALLWKPIVLAINPRAAVADASAKTAAAMADRFGESPLGALMSALAYAQDGTVDVDIQVDDHYSPVSASLSFSTDAKNRRLSALTNVESAGHTLNLFTYLDPECIVAASDELTGGKYYGITLDSFSEDLRKSYLYDKMDEENIKALENLVDFLNSILSGTKTDGVEIDVTPYTDIVNAYVKSLEVKRSRDTLRMDGKSIKCTVISTKMDLDKLFDMAIQLVKTARNDKTISAYFTRMIGVADMGMGDMEDVWKDSLMELRETLDEASEYISGTPTYSWYIYKGRLVSCRVTGELEVDTGWEKMPLDISFAVNCGTDPSTSDLEATLEITADGETLSMECLYSSKSSKDRYSDCLSLSLSVPYGDTQAFELECSWNKANGDLENTVSYKQHGNPVSFTLDSNLIADKKGVRFTLDEIKGVDASFSLFFHEGKPEKKPDYINLDKWDEDVISEIIENAKDTFSN